MSPDKKRRAVREIEERLGYSERRVCRVLEQPRSTQRHEALPDVEEDRLRDCVVSLATQFGRYGYRPVTSLLQGQGWHVNHKRVERIWREEGLKVPQKQRKRRRLWLEGASCVRLRATHRNHVWSYDFMTDQTSDGRPFRILNIIDEFSRECLLSHAARKITAYDVIELLADLFLLYGVPEYIRSDNGPEFVATTVRGWLGRLGVQALLIEPGSPWENGYIESFNGKLRYELLDGEIFDTILEARILVERWRRQYNTVRPHSSLGFKAPAPETYKPLQVANA